MHILRIISTAALWLSLQSIALAKGSGAIEPKARPSYLPDTGDFGELFTRIINYFLGFVGLIAVLMLVLGGFWYLTSGGNEQQIEKGKNTIVYAIIGIVIIVISYAVVRTLTTELGEL